MIRPLEGTSPPVDPPQKPRRPGKSAAKAAAQPLGADRAHLTQVSRPRQTLSLRAGSDDDVRKVIADAETSVLLVTSTIPTDDMVKMLSKAAKKDLRVEVRFHVQPHETDVTRTFREEASVALRDAGVAVTWGPVPATVTTPPTAVTPSGKLWVDGP